MPALSLLQPTGHLTLGNLLGALAPMRARQDTTRCFYGVADLHALTVPHDPARLRQLTTETATMLLAAGLDRSTLFVQSHVPAHAELSYLLESTVSTGELGRMIQFKEKGRGRPTTRASLLTYPALMAADIPLCRPEQVPVGDDQRQHVELTRDLAQRFNRDYGPVFTVPEIVTPPAGARVMDLAHPATKMGKSHEDDRGTVHLLDPPDVVRRKVARAVTDSDTGPDAVRPDREAKPGVTNLLEVLVACGGKPGRADDVRRSQGRRHRRSRRRARAAATVVRRAGRGPRARAPGVRRGGRRCARGHRPGPGRREGGDRTDLTVFPAARHARRTVGPCATASVPTSSSWRRAWSSPGGGDHRQLRGPARHRASGLRAAREAGRRRHGGRSMSPEEALLAVSAAHLGFQVVVSAVVYPALADVPGGRWAAAHERHSRRIAAVVGPLYVAVAAACLWALLSTPDVWTLVAVGGNAVAVLVTATMAAPLHGRLSGARGSAVLLARLRRVDLVRTAATAVAVVGALLT